MGTRGLLAVPLLAACLLVSLVAPASGASPGPRIVGGSGQQIANFPWQAAIVLAPRFGVSPFNGQFCDGTLIAPQIVQTAAHCVYDTDPDCQNNFQGPGDCLPADNPGDDGTTMLDGSDVNVVLGRDHLSGTGGIEEPVATTHGVYIDSAYQPATLTHDLAWLILQDPVTPAPTIKTIQIAGSSEGAVWATAGTPTVASGWGATNPGATQAGNNNFPDQLQAAVLPRISDATCGSPAVWNFFFIPSTMVCAGSLGGTPDTCFGDSGGPLQAPIAQSPGYRLVGVVSWGAGQCAAPNGPAVFARIADTALTTDVQNELITIAGDHPGIDTSGVFGSGAAPLSPPTFTGTSPSSGTNANNPLILGSVFGLTPGTGTIKLYTNDTCTGTPAATDTDTQLASAGIQVSVPDNSSTTFYGTTTTGLNTSPCSVNSITYTELTPGPTPPLPPTPTTTKKKCKKGKHRNKHGKCVKKKK